MKIIVQIFNKVSGITQNGTIEQPMQDGYDIQNALAIFGIEEYQLDSVIEYDDVTSYCGKAEKAEIYFTLITLT